MARKYATRYRRRSATTCEAWPCWPGHIVDAKGRAFGLTPRPNFDSNKPNGSLPGATAGLSSQDEGRRGRDDHADRDYLPQFT